MKDDRGQATLEVALLVPVIALLLAVIVGVGAVAGKKAQLELAAREAVRIAAVDPDTARIRYAAERIGFEDVEMQVSPDADRRVSGEPITVSLSYRPLTTTPLVGDLFSTLVLEATATMRIEQP